MITTLADGTIINGSCASDGGGKIWIVIDDPEDPHNSIVNLAMILTAEATARITYQFMEEEPKVFEGYTEVDVIRMNSDGICSARLRKPTT